MDYNISSTRKFDVDALKEILYVDKEKWLQEAKEIEGYYNNVIQSRVPSELWHCVATLYENCKTEEAPKKPAAKSAAGTKKLSSVKSEKPAEKPAVKKTTADKKKTVKK